VELGGYVGYSALLFASTPEFLSNPNRRYISIEQNPVFASIIAAFVKLAGLDSFVRVVVGQSSTALPELEVDRIDMLFLDHYKPAYTPDLKLCEMLQLVRGGTVLVADNVLKPGNPRYLEYVRMSVEEKVVMAKKVGDGKEGDEMMGNPKLIYESRYVESFEPTGILVCSLFLESSWRES
jgi:catechol O-methyltransferase